jgi:hypothetical protein
MAGCIALFSRIDPEVRVIRTFSGDTVNTSYFLKAGEWQAYPEPVT